jgi:hypothetical protein
LFIIVYNKNKKIQEKKKIIMNNSSVQDIVNKIPTYIYFSELPDRQQALKYVNYLYENVPQSKTVDQDKLYREVIARELRIVSMKIIEPEILIMIGLNKITLQDFTSPSNELVRKIVSENPDKYDLDILYRVLAQIMTKLPKDLKERVAGKHKLQIFQLVAKFIKMEPKLLEKFIAYDPSLNTPITMDLDQGDYNTLNKKYLQELYNFQQKQPYLNSNSLEYGALASQLAQTTPTATPANNIKAQYIDQSPDMMLGTKDNTLYYFDSSSGTISEMPLNAKQTPVSVSDLKTILASSKINQGDIQSSINSLTLPITNATNGTTTTAPSGFISGLENMFKGLQTGTTQAQAVITTQANLPDNSPIPPAFLTKLYNLKKGKHSNEYGNALNSSDVYSDGSNTGLYASLYSNQNLPNYMQSDSIQSDAMQSDSANNSDGYLIRGIPHTKITNPKATYTAFSGPSIPTKPTGPAGNPTFPGGRVMTNFDVQMDKIFYLLNKTYNNTQPIYTNPSTTIPSTTTPSTTSQSPSTTSQLPSTTSQLPSTTSQSPSTTSISHFSNMNNNMNNKNMVQEKIKNNNKDIENIALGFVTVIILLFLVVIFNSIRNSNSTTK